MGEEKVEEHTMEIYTEIKSSIYKVARRMRRKKCHVAKFKNSRAHLAQKSFILITLLIK